MTNLIFTLLFTLLPLLARGQVEQLKCASNSETSLASQTRGILRTSLLSLANLQLKLYGPNCWNSALIASGILRSPRHVTNSEFWFWMNSEYCSALKPAESPRTGDIGSLFWKHKGNFHSFMRVDDNIAFSKGGPDPALKYELTSYESMFYENYQEMAKTCKGSEENLLKNRCEFQVVYHRCRPLEGNLFSGIKELAEISSQVDRIEENLSKAMLNPESLPANALSAQLEDLGRHFDRIRAMTLEGKKDFARKALEHRIIGLLFTDLNEEIYKKSEAARAAVSQAYNVAVAEKERSPSTPDQVKRQ